MSSAAPGNAASRTKHMALSRQTYVISAVLVLLAAVFYLLSAAVDAGSITGTATDIIYVFGISLPALAAAIILAIAFSLGARESVGRQWLLIGIGAALYAVGDIVWMIIELFMGLDPYPSAADIFYVLEYVFFCWAMILAVSSFRGFVSLKKPALGGAIIGAVSLIAVYLLVLEPYIFPAGTEELGTWGLVVSTLYPVGDVVFMLVPAITLALTIGPLGAGRLAWPWWIVVLGVFIFAITDTYYSYADWSGIGITALQDLGWILAHMLFAIAALVARDVYRS